MNCQYSNIEYTACELGLLTYSSSLTLIFPLNPQDDIVYDMLTEGYCKDHVQKICLAQDLS